MDKDTVHRRIVIETGDLLEKLGFADGFGKSENFTINACLKGVSRVDEGLRMSSYLFSSFQFHANIGC